MLSCVKLQEIFYPDENLDRKGQYKTNYQSCPKGKVPILKQRNGTKSVHLDTVEYPGQHVNFYFFSLFLEIYPFTALQKNIGTDWG